MDKEKFESLKALNMAHDSALQMLILAPSMLSSRPPHERVAFYREACAYLAALSIVIGVSKDRETDQTRHALWATLERSLARTIARHFPDTWLDAPDGPGWHWMRDPDGQLYIVHLYASADGLRTIHGSDPVYMRRQWQRVAPPREG